MDKRVVLAVAGAGKTYTICNSINKDERALILAFTNQNIRNIKKEIRKNSDLSDKEEIPPYIHIMTFDSFIYRLILRPFFPSYCKEFGYNYYKMNGIVYKDSPKPSHLINGNRVSNPRYFPVNDIRHYFCGSKLYGSLMTRLCIEKKGVLERAIKQLEEFWDVIYVDEFQDFRNDKYNFISFLATKFPKVVLVGDYYQHSVSGTNNSGMPFKKIRIGSVCYDSYIQNLKENKYQVDNTSLIQSRRCSKDVCDFVNKKLDIHIESCEINKGAICWVSDDNIKSVLDDNEIVKLVEKMPYKYTFNAVSWSYSKGDTYQKTCVILTEPFENIDSPFFNYSESDIMRNKFYVALTRTKGDLYILKKSLFDRYKNYYLKNIQ